MRDLAQLAQRTSFTTPSETPRTDAICLETNETGAWDFARQLERELNQTREILQSGLDRDKDDTITPHLAVVAVNAIAQLRDENERLKTLLQEQHEGTDAELAKTRPVYSEPITPDFARQLERELNEANQSIQQWQEIAEQLRAENERLKTNEPYKTICECNADLCKERDQWRELCEQMKTLVECWHLAMPTPESSEALAAYEQLAKTL